MRDVPGFRQAALDAAADGLCVFPLWPRSKRPAVIADWEGRASRDPADIRAWWGSGVPYNIGIACGPSGLHVIDLDDAHGCPPPSEWSGARHGWDVLARIAAEQDQSMPTETRIIATPNAGWHLWHLAPDGPGLRNTQARLGWRIDSRAAGGYVVGPGSACAQGMYRVAQSAPIAPLPQWLAAAFTPAPVPETPSNVDLPPLSTVRADAYIARVSDGVAHAEPGTRHTTLLRAANSLGRLVAGGDLDEGEARAALHTAAAGLGHDFPIREAETTISDGLAHGARYPRRLATS